MALLIIAISVVALIFLLLVQPLGIGLSASFHGRAIFRARIKYFFGLFSLELSSERKRRHEHDDNDTGGKGGYALHRVFDAVQVRGFGSSAWLLAKRLVRRVNIKSIKSDLSVSLGDDYYTGMLAGLAIPLVLYLNQRYNGEIMLRPAFEEDPFIDGDITGYIQVRPFQALLPCLAFALSPQFRQARRVMAGGLCQKK